MKKIKQFSGQGIAVRGNDIDTDRIIPARYMKCVTFDGLGQYAFNDERVDGKGASKGHPFDDHRWNGHSVMVVNANFGCGSSREHAPQALKDYGIHCIVGESFAEIFAGNCSTMGIPVVTMDPDSIAQLQATVENQPDVSIDVDLEGKKVCSNGQCWEMDMPESYRQALLTGTWDSTALLSESMVEVEKVAASLPYV